MRRFVSALQVWIKKPRNSMLLGVIAVVVALGVIGFCVLPAHKNITVTPASQHTTAKQTPAKSTGEVAAATTSQPTTAQAPAPQKSTASKPATPAAQPTGPVDFTLSATAVTVSAGERSAVITAKTTDGRKVAWLPSFNMSAPYTAFTDTSENVNPVSTYTFYVGVPFNVAAGTYTTYMSAYVPQKDPSKNVFVKKYITVTVTAQRTFAIQYPGVVDGDPNGDQVSIPFTISRQNGHTAAVSVVRSFFPTACTPGVSIAAAVMTGSDSGKVTVNIAPDVVSINCTIRVVATDGTYTTFNDFLLYN
jgi:hypothetical protein